MKLTLRLLLLSLCTNFLGATVFAAERPELRRESMVAAVAARPATPTTRPGSRLPALIMSGGRVNLGERLALSPLITKGGFAMRVNLNF